MTVQRFAMIFGIIYVVVGIAGFLPMLLQPMEPEAPPLTIDTLAGRLMGLFPVNVLHTIVHLLVGIWGVLAAKSFGASVGFAKSIAVFYGVLMIMGLIPGLNNVFGLIPLHSHDIWLHAVSALVAAYFGWGSKERVHRA